MTKYNIRIDGDVMPSTYTYEELLLHDIFDFDDIEVKPTTHSTWTNINEFYFPEEHQEDDALGNSEKDVYSGTGSETQKQQNFIIDEFGQVVSNKNIGGGSSSTASSASSSSRYRDNHSGDDKSSAGIVWKIILTIITIIIFIVITCTTGWGSIPAGAVGFVALRAIWSDKS